MVEGLGGAWIRVFGHNPQAQTPLEGILSLRGMPEAIFNSCLSLGMLSMGYSAYLLDN